MNKIVITRELIVKASPQNGFKLSHAQMRYLGFENRKGFKKRILGVELDSDQVEFLFMLKYMSKRKLKRIEINPIDLPMPSVIPVRKIRNSTKKLSKKDYRQRQREYNDYLKSDKWREKRNIVLLRDDFKCTKCGSKHELHIHHLTYANFKNEPSSDLITLCRICHKKEHKR